MAFFLPRLKPPCGLTHQWFNPTSPISSILPLFLESQRSALSWFSSSASGPSQPSQPSPAASNPFFVSGAFPSYIRTFVPPPRYGITVEAFLKKIGKDCEAHKDKFKTWDELMLSSGRELKKKEIPVKQRRWILNWVHKYKKGVEPEHIRFQSKAKKNKTIAKKMQEKHEAVIKAKQKKKLDEKNAKRAAKGLPALKPRPPAKKKVKKTAEQLAREEKKKAKAARERIGTIGATKNLPTEGQAKTKSQPAGGKKGGAPAPAAGKPAKK